MNPAEGLLHVPCTSPWDPETFLWAPPGMVYEGVTDGWAWATDTCTICAAPTDAPASDPQPTAAPSVLRYITADVPAPLYKVAHRHLAALGGHAVLRDWGPFNLDRVTQAAFWALTLDDGVAEHLVAAPAASDRGPTLRLIGPTGRMAFVIGLVQKGWLPQIDLPAEAVA